jgi:hypothetical protein
VLRSKAQLWLFTALMLAESACTAGPRRVEFPAPQPFTERQQLEIWRAGKARTLHAVVQSGDRLSGVPVHRPPSCDSCRVTFAVAEIDSVRAVDIERAALLIHGMVFGFAAVALIAWRNASDD